MKIFLFLVTLIGCAFSAFGANLYVTNTDDSGVGSLRGELASATSGDTIFINVAGTLNVVGGSMTAVGNICIIGPGASHFSINSSSIGGRAFSLGSSSILTIESVAFTGTTGSQTIIDAGPGSDLTLRNCLFEGNSTNCVRAISSSSGNTNITIEGCSFISNSSSYNGVALSVTGSSGYYSTVNVVNSTFYDNTITGAGNGAAVFVGYSNVTLTNNTFVNNKKSGTPSTFYLNTGGNITCRNNIIYDTSTSSTQGIVSSGGSLVSVGGNVSNESNGASDGLNHISDVTGSSVDPVLNTTLIEDGWGLKYLTYADDSSPGIDIDTNPSGLPLYDQRRAWRVMDGGVFAEYADAGAIEYSQLTIRAAGTGVGSFEDLYQTVYNTAGVGKNAFVFEINSAGAHENVAISMPWNLFKDSTIVNGFSQNSSIIPGPGSTAGSVTSAYTPIIVNKSIGNNYGGIEITGNDVVVCGISLVEFTDFGIRVSGANAEISGCHIGVRENGTIQSSNKIGVFADMLSSPKIGSGNYCGYLYHSNRNVISGNTDAQIVINTGVGMTIQHNFIGLSSDGITAPTGSLAIADTGIAIRPMTGNDPVNIGGIDTTDFNVIGGQSIGISIAAPYNSVLNNIIGGTFTGEAISGDTYNTTGIKLWGTDTYDNNLGTWSGYGNTIIGNGVGVHITDEASNNGLFHNHIGVSKSGSLPLGNSDEGVLISGPGTMFNEIGLANYMANVISNNSTGIKISNDASNNSIKGNIIGFSGDGNETPMGNNTSGIEIEGWNAYDNVIGGAGAGNLIGNNGQDGILLTNGSSHTIVQGNLIGLESDTIAEAGNNLNGIYVEESSSYNLIGGCGVDEGNYIGHNGYNGIEFYATPADHDTVYGNIIGVSVDGGDVGNDLSGIAISSSASFIVIGSTNVGCANEIAFNEDNGITLSDQCEGNTISGNSIHNNLGLGIDIDDDGAPDYSTDFGLTGNNATPIGTVSSCVTCGSTTSFTITPESTGFVYYEVFKADGDAQEGDSLIFTWSGNVSYFNDTTITMPFALPTGMDLVMTATIGTSTSEFGPSFTVTSISAITGTISSNTVCTFPSITPELSVTGEVGVPVWFSDAGMTNRLGSGIPFNVPFSDVTAVGSYEYYVSDSVAGCYGPVSSAVNLSVVVPPVYSIAGPDTICTDGSYQFSVDRPTTFNSIYWGFTQEGTPGTSFYNSINYYNPFPGSEELFNVDTYGSSNSGFKDTITVEIDSAGCVSYDVHPVSVIYFAQPDTDSVFNPTTCGGTDGYVGIGGLTPAETLTLYYDAGSSASITVDGNGWLFLTGLGAGTYNLDSIGNGICNAYIGMELIIEDPVGHTISGVTQYDPSTCGGNGMAVIYLSAGAGFGPYTVDLDGGTTIVTNLMSAGDSLTISGLIDGHVILNPVVTDETTLCSDTYTYSGTITDPSSPVANAGSDVTICEGDVTTLLGGPTGGGLSYSWDNGGGNTMNANVSPLTTTTYTLSVTESSTGCVGTDQVNVTVNSAPTISGESDVCSGGTVNLMPNTGGTWTANNPTDFTIDNTGLVTAIGFGSGDFTFTDANGCFSTSSIITVNPTPDEGNPGITDVLCHGGSDGGIMLLPGGTYSHSWTGPNSFTSTSQSISGLEAGNYTNTMTDVSTGCTRTFTISINEPSSLPDFTYTSTDVSCNGVFDGTISLVGTTGVAPYTFSVDGFTYAGTNNFYGLSAGAYNCYIKDVNNCISNVQIVNISEPTALTAVASVTSSYNGEDISCNGLSDGEMTVVPSGGTSGYNFQWYIGASPIAGATGALLSNQPANTYNVNVTDLNGCVVNEVITLTEPTLLTVSAGIDQTMCSGESVTLSGSVSGGTGVLNYSWTPSGTLSDPNVLNPVATPAINTTYTLTVNDVNGCTNSDGVDVTVNLSPLLSETHTDPSCFGSSDGTIALTATGGISPYQYSINGGGTYTSTNTFNGLSNGSNTCVIQDGNGCESTSTIVVLNNPAEIIVSAAVTSSYNGEDISCFGASTGELTATASGGTGTLTYSWDQGVVNYGVNPIATGLSSGSYDLTVTDDNGCQATTSATLTDPSQFIITNVISSNPSCFGELDGSLEVVYSGGTGLGYVDWYNDAYVTWVSSDNPYTGVGAGTYYVEAVDANGCVAQYGPEDLIEPNLLNVTWSLTDESCFGAADGELDTTSVTGGTAPFTLDWFELPSYNNIGSTAPLGGRLGGEYVGLVTDANGCEFRDTVTINDGEAFTPSVVIAAQSGNCLGNNSFDFVDNNTAPPSGGVDFSWVFPNATPSTSTSQTPMGISFNASGTHAVTYTVTSYNGCVYDDTLDVVIGDVANVYAGADQSICEGDFANLTGTPNSTAYSYSWAVGLNPGIIEGTDANITVSPTTSIYYVLTVTENSTGCTGADSVSIIVNPIPNPTIDQLGPIDLCENNEGTYLNLSATSSDSTAGTFSWYVGSVTSTPVTGGQLALDNSNVGNHFIYLQESNASGCVSIFDSIQLTLVENDLELTAEPTFCLGDEVAIDATGSGAIVWINSQGEIADTLASSTVAMPTAENTIYYAEMFFDECIFVDSLILNIDSNCGNSDITVNAFSPDGDGVNDYFILDIPSILKYDNNVTIFNRWGDEIGSFQNYNNADVVWDGKTQSGEYVTNGTFFYVIEVPELNIKESGWIQVVR